MKKAIITTGGLLVLSFLLNACGSDANDADADNDSDPSSVDTSNDITGSVMEWEVDVDSMAAEAGTVNFTITNDGTIGHEFLIVKTDIAPGEIPVNGDHFPEDASGIEVIDEIGEFKKGTTRS